MPSDGGPGDRVPRDRVPSDGGPGDRVPSDGGPGDRVPRDRDPSGRPRNARPRDGLGRPLDRAGAGVGQDRIPDDLVITGRDAAVLADQLLRDGRPFHAHEVLEAAWKTGPPGDRDLWQGLAQIAVGLTHARRGNARGAVTLLRRGTQRIRIHQATTVLPATPVPPPSPVPPHGSLPPHEPLPPHGAAASHGPSAPYGMDIPAVLAAMEDLAARVERDGLDHIPAAALVPHLLTGNG